MSIIIVQCLCPKRHCIIANAADVRSAEELKSNLRKQTEYLIKAEQINAWCGICGAKSSEWLYEAGVTSFKTMDEAFEHLRREEARQKNSKSIMDQMGLTYDASRLRRN